MQILNTIYLPLILLSMIFMHIVDDFYLQGKLVHFKRKKYWDQFDPILYKNDYKIALALHAFSWSFCIHIPIIIHILYCDGYYSPIFFLLSFIINWIIHIIVDDLKANQLKINLVQDQLIHLIQVIITWIIYIILL